MIQSQLFNFAGFQEDCIRKFLCWKWSQFTPSQTLPPPHPTQHSQQKRLLWASAESSQAFSLAPTPGRMGQGHFPAPRMSGLGGGWVNTGLYLNFVFNVIPDAQHHNPQNSLQRGRKVIIFLQCLPPPPSREDSRIWSSASAFSSREREVFATRPPHPHSSPHSTSCGPSGCRLRPLPPTFLPSPGTTCASTHSKAFSTHSACRIHLNSSIPLE